VVTAWTWIQNHRWLSVLFLTIVVLGTAGGTCWAVFFRTVASPINLRDALRLYRNTTQTGTRGTADASDESTRGASLLVPGVYSYRTTGGESLSLPGADRSFPSETQVIVSDNDRACSTMEWVPIEQHTESTMACPGSHHSTVISSFVTHEVISNSTTTTIIDCPSTLYLVPPIAVPGSHWSAVCRQVAPAEPVAVTGEVLSSAPIMVGGVSVPAYHVHLVMSFRGSADTGSSPVDLWFSTAKGLLLKEQEVAQISQDGVHYTETMGAVLESLSPAT
jgi:hypothetical protein